jgi:hypothetical protein
MIKVYESIIWLDMSCSFIGNGFKEILKTKFLTKGKKLPKISLLWR